MTPESENGLSYTEKAFIAFNDIMANKKRDTLDSMNRANKGELFVLHFLTMHTRAVLPTEISIALNASTARISALLGALEKKGQIGREIDKNNRRYILVTITAAGRERVEVEMKKLQNSITFVFDEMGEADTADFIRLLKKFMDISQKHMPFPVDE